jgi:hypothetical protein
VDLNFDVDDEEINPLYEPTMPGIYVGSTGASTHDWNFGLFSVKHDGLPEDVLTQEERDQAFHAYMDDYRARARSNFLRAFGVSWNPDLTF